MSRRVHLFLWASFYYRSSCWLCIVQDDAMASLLMLGFQNEKGVKGHKKQAQETKNCRSKLNKPEFRVEVYRAEVKAEGEGWGVGRQEHTGLEDQNGGPGVLTCYKKSNTVEGGGTSLPQRLFISCPFIHPSWYVWGTLGSPETGESYKGHL